MMRAFNWSSLRSGRAQIQWPPGVDLTTAKTKQQIDCFAYELSGETQYVFGLTVEIVGRVDAVTNVRVKWSGGILTSTGEQLPPPRGYEPGTLIPVSD